MRFVSSDDARDASYALVWDVGLEITTGDVPRTTTAVADRLVRRAADVGIVFTSDAVVAEMAGALIAAFGPDSECDAY